MKKSNTYSFIMEFRGGTYCSQVKATDLEKAVSSWANKLSKQKNQVAYLTSDMLDKLKNEIKTGAQPTKLKRLKNIWFMSLLATKDRMYINIVKTYSNS